VILPGETKDVLNKVMEAVAQANPIKRREETAARRSLLNTARLIDEDKLTVFADLDGVL
jgi:hypothetical protein